MAEKCKSCEIYRKIWDMYREVSFSKRNVYTAANQRINLYELKSKVQSMEWKKMDSQVK